MSLWAHPLQAQQGLQHEVVCRACSQELEAHVQVFPALLYGLTNASLAEGKHLFECAHVVSWQRHAYVDLSCLEIGLFHLQDMGPLFLTIHHEQLGLGMRKSAP